MSTQLNPTRSSHAFEPINDRVPPPHPDDILADPTLAERTFSRADDLLRLVVSLGRLSRGHSLIMPGPRAKHVESIGSLILAGLPCSIVEDAIRACHRASAGVFSSVPRYQVLFEHGNSGDRSTSRYGTHVAHLHSIWTGDRDRFAEELTQVLSAERGWFRVDGWQRLAEVASEEKEYCFVQPTASLAWCRTVDDSEDLPKQYLRMLVHTVLVRMGERHASSPWIWRAANDLSDALEDARLMRASLAASRASVSSNIAIATVA